MPEPQSFLAVRTGWPKAQAGNRQSMFMGWRGQTDQTPGQFLEEAVLTPEALTSSATYITQRLHTHNHGQ